MKIQIFFFLGVCAITLHFTILLGIEGARYFSLKEEAKAHIKQWEIEEIKNRFALKADYTFDSQGKSWQGSSTLLPPHYLNEMAALEALKGRAKESWTVWHNPKNPQVSALEKSFPTGLLIRSLICYGVLVYFVLLKRRVALYA
jgi:hypothetical protein